MATALDLNEQEYLLCFAILARKKDERQSQKTFFLAYHIQWFSTGFLTEDGVYFIPLFN